MRKKLTTAEIIRGTGLLTGLGVMLVLSTLAGYGLGWLVDGWLHIDLFKYVGVILGTVAGMIEIVRLARAVEKND